MRETWAGRFDQLEVLGETSAFQVVSARDLRADRRGLVVAAAPGALDDASVQALERLFLAHREPPHPAIARAVAFEPARERPFVLFDAEVRCDLDGLIRTAADHGYKATHAEADGFIVTLRDALRASARRVDPRTGHPMCLGTIGFGNVCFGPDGSFWLIGFGHNVVVHDAHGRMNARSRFFQAPEIAVGAPATASSDFVALLQLTRAAMAFVELDLSIARCIAGNSVAEDIELARRILWIERHAVHASPAHRASIAQIVRVSDRIRELIGVWPEPEAFRRKVAVILGTHGGPEAPAPLRIASDGAWFAFGDGERVELSSRRVLARLLALLAAERAAHPGGNVTAAALIAVGWPGERAHPRSATNRLYVSINALRKAGLGGALVRGSGGYRLSEAVQIERRAPESVTGF